MVDNNKNQVMDIGKATFSLFSFKTKIIIIGVIIVVFLLIIVPVVAITSIFTPHTKNSSQKKGGNGGSDSVNTSVAISVNEIFDENSLTKYANATFPMPFERWDKSKDIVTSRFSKSRTITVNRSYTNKSTYWNRYCMYFKIKSKSMCSSKWKGCCCKSRFYWVRELCCYSAFVR